MPVIELFNSSLEAGQWISASTTNLTGDSFLTLLVMLIFLVLLAMIFRMPIFIVGLILFPILLIMATMSAGFSMVVGLVILIIGLAIFSMYPVK